MKFSSLNTYYIRFAIAGIFFGILLSAVLMNSGLLNLTLSSKVTKGSSLVTSLTPASRFDTIPDNSGEIIKQKGDVLYFSSDMSRDYDTATITLLFRNPSSQNLFLGFQDKSGWHYQTVLIDAPVLNQLSWSRLNQDQTILYQRNPVYKSIEEFISNPPDSPVGVYNYDKDLFNSNTPLPDYQPAKNPTVINTPLRGSYTMYLYVYNQPFDLSFQKQDLNWYEGRDTMDISVYKGSDIVFTATADDDGITTATTKSLNPQVINIRNPGPELPENGVYKIVVNASSDVVTSRLQTNLHKIVFDSSLYPIGTKPVSLYTDASSVSLKTYHPTAYQTVTVNRQQFNLKEDEVKLNIDSDPLTAITLPKSDVTIKSPYGYYSFSPDSFFKPQSANIINVTTVDQTTEVDYIIANYSPSKTQNQWSEAQVEFNLDNAYSPDNRLNWIILSPGLNKNSSHIYLKSIDLKLQQIGKLQL